MTYNKFKTVIIFDTNTFYISFDKGYDFRSYTFSKRFKTLVDIIETNDLVEDYVVAIPEVVLQELKKQFYDGYINSYEEIKKKCSANVFPNFSYADIEFNIKDHCFDAVDKELSYYRKNDVEIITLENTGKESFDKILYNAIHKLPPFEGSNKKSDKGFKDAVICESIIDYVTHSNHDKYIVCSGDKLINEALLNSKIEDITILDYNEVVEIIKNDAIRVSSRVYDFVDSDKLIKRIFKNSKTTTVLVNEKYFSLLHFIVFHCSDYDYDDENIYKLRLENISFEDKSDQHIIICVDIWLEDCDNLDVLLPTMVLESIGDKLYVTKLYDESDNVVFDNKKYIVNDKEVSDE